MNALDFINLNRNSSEEELKNIIMASYWSVDEVPSLCDGIDGVESLSTSDLRECLESAVNGSDSDDDVRDALRELVRRKVEEKRC